MDVEFRNHDGEDGFCEDSVKNRFRTAIQYFEKELLTLYPRLSKSDLDEIVIILCDATHKENEASCIRNTVRKNEFLIQMVFSGNFDVIEKLAHELCHVMQHLSGSLVVKNEKLGIVTWNDEQYRMHEIKHPNRPWEKEAIINGMKLHGQYVSACKADELIE